MSRWFERALKSAAIVVSAVLHVGLLFALTRAAEQAPPERARVLQFEVVRPEPEPPEPPAPQKEDPPEKLEPPKPKPKPIEQPTVDLTKKKLPEDDVPPPPNTQDGEEPAEEAKPVFGVSMSSVVGPGKGSGFKVRVGNTLMKEREEEFTPPEEVKKYEPVPLVEVNERPKFPKGICKPDYPPEAKQMQIEGRMRLEVELREDGTVGEVKVVEGLGHGLDEAAIRSIRDCPFEPAKKAGRPVTTRIPIVITFVLED